MTIARKRIFEIGSKGQMILILFPILFL